MKRKAFQQRAWLCSILSLLLLGGVVSGLLSSCSESEDEDADEYANWKARNDAFYASLADSLSSDPAHWQRLVLFSKDEATADATDYVYVKKIISSGETERPLYTDSVRLSYLGRLIPTKTYTQGLIFDGTTMDTFNLLTNATTKSRVSSYVAGFSTALLYMHRGDYWRVFIPYTLAYGSSANGSTIPAYSTLIFDVALVDFSPAGQRMRPWSVKKQDD